MGDALASSPVSPVRRTSAAARRNVLLDAFGLACYIAWSYVFWDTPLFLEGPAADDGFAAGPLLLAQGVFTGVAAFALMLLWGRVAPLRRNVPVLAAFTLAEVGAVVLAAMGQGGFASVLAVVGFSLSGAGSAMRLGWEERMSVRGVRAAAMRAATGYAIGSALYAAIVALPSEAAVAVTALLPMASLALLIWQERRAPDDGVVASDPAIEPVGMRESLSVCFRRVPWRIPAFVVLSYFCYGATRMDSLRSSLAAAAPGAFAVVVAMMACCTGVVLAYVAYRKSVQAGIYIAVPLLAAAGLCNTLGVPHAEMAVLYVANVGVEITKYLMLFLMIDVIIKDGAPALLCLALLRFAQWGGSALGQAVADVVPAGMGIAVVILLVLIVALLLVMGAFPPARGGERIGADGLPGAFAIPPRGLSAAGQGGAPEAAGVRDGRADGGGIPIAGLVDASTLASRVEMAAERYALSPRETQVLAIWATGRSAAYVERTLFISQGTVKTHLNHIYAKTGTANRGELFELLDGIADDAGHAQKPDATGA